MSLVEDGLEWLIMAFEQHVAQSDVARVEADSVQASLLLDQDRVGHLAVDELLLKIHRPVEVSALR